MSPQRQRQILGGFAIACALAAVLLGAFAYVKLRPAPATQPPAKLPAADFAPAPHIATETWSVFAPAVAAGASTNDDATPRRFRLAGTFFAFGTQESRKAILDDLQTKLQSIVGQGEDVAGYTVEEIGADRAVLVRGTERMILTLGFAAPGSQTATAAAAPAIKLSPGEKVLEENRFGKKVGESRWVFSRRELLNYYQELLDNPDRIAALYMSMKPEYKNEEITGYRLGQEGEREFFKAVGLQEGDVLRKVNSMNMTSQARAEYFISEFVKNRLQAVVIDLERNGQPQKLIYLTQ